VCPTEIIAFSDAAESFEKKNCAIIGVSTDSAEVHLAWINTPRKKGGLGQINIPLIADVTRRISIGYGVLGAGNFPFRGMFLMDPKARVLMNLNACYAFPKSISACSPYLARTVRCVQWKGRLL
jgi:alkyl hydroperoxide reductase subunit AhpC